ncbi:hypothetical protein TSMEX_005557, partial [Taenia solium]
MSALRFDARHCASFDVQARRSGHQDHPGIPTTFPTIGNNGGKRTPQLTLEETGETTYQQRLYHQHIARSVRNLRRYRHIYGDSFTSVLASTKAPSSEERENSTSSIPSMQHRRSSADEALIARVVSGKEEPISPPSPPPSSTRLMLNLEQRCRRRHLFISHRSVQSESQRQVDEAIAVATVIVALESDENT